jgi:C4-type Zn-finger protein
MSYKYHEPLEVEIVESSTPIRQATIVFTKTRQFLAKVFRIQLVQLYNHTLKVTIKKARKGRGYVSFIGPEGILRDLDGNYWRIIDSDSTSSREYEILELVGTIPMPKIQELSGKLFVAKRGSYGKE